VAGGDLDVSDIDACVETGRDKGAAEHVRVRPGDLDAAVSAS
jgi:hypothetical protein